ncbi:hypothetical protein EYF80_060380 [Liparis tanakae]|uniref:Uncharacterized protein n=1 Tax=Liparis tanakae TaxID=230148 RepID=A0A4Z2EM90_9TELE|nr:hypothetical protein EYF80_060380 [Liparis tanakae]
MGTSRAILHPSVVTALDISLPAAAAGEQPLRLRRREKMGPTPSTFHREHLGALSVPNDSRLGCGGKVVV